MHFNCFLTFQANVMGQHCDQCKNGTFGLHPEQPDGCINCFCFGRTTLCTEAGLTWSQLRTTRPRTLNINYDNTSSVDTNFPVNTQEVCYINVSHLLKIEVILVFGLTKPGFAKPAY